MNSVRNFRLLRTLIANISRTDRDIDKRKKTLSTTMPPAFVQKHLVNFGRLTTNFTCLISTHLCVSRKWHSVHN